MANLHAFLDEYTVSLAALLSGRDRFFEDSVDSPSLGEHLQAIALEMPEIRGEGYYEAPARSAVGSLDPGFHLARWLGPSYPTIIYHHGNNERPFDYGPFSKNTFRNTLMGDRHAMQANLISLRAPYHTSLREYLARARELACFAAMLMTSVGLVDTLVGWSREGGSPRVMVTGISLGGWVSNLHRAHCNSADVYVPIMAGAALDDVFVGSAYRKLAGRAARENPEKVRATLNFEDDYARVADRNVFPLLARHDRIIRFERQQQSYGRHPVAAMEKGHTTGTLARQELRRHIARHLGRDSGR
jgi:hypothetical protein